ncbi:MAG: hypothetical protein HUU16_06495 [Candidatus Omnitrophica bacterium]|nr:hypothetical protein [bacterium]NUN95803.1 hypothetical protein [Candidatus Omnitrophota bacterium]
MDTARFLGFFCGLLLVVSPSSAQIETKTLHLPGDLGDVAVGVLTVETSDEKAEWLSSRERAPVRSSHGLPSRGDKAFTCALLPYFCLALEWKQEGTELLTDTNGDMRINAVDVLNTLSTGPPPTPTETQPVGEASPTPTQTSVPATPTSTHTQAAPTATHTQAAATSTPTDTQAQPTPTNTTAPPTATSTATQAAPTVTNTQPMGGNPVITGITPRVADPGAEVTLTGTGFGNGPVNVDVGGTVVPGNAGDTQVTFTMPSVQGMNFLIHCAEVRVITPNKAVSNALAVGYPSRYDQPNDMSAILSDVRYTPAAQGQTARFELDVAITTNRTSNVGPLALSSPAVIIHAATTDAQIPGVGTDNDDTNPFISSFPVYDYRFEEPVFSDSAHRLEFGETTTPRTWIVAADDPSVKAISLDIAITELARVANAHAADLSNTPDFPTPFGVAYDPVTGYVHVTGDPEAWIYGVKASSVDQEIAIELSTTGKGPSYITVAPAGQDPIAPNGRIFTSVTHPETLNTDHMVAALDASTFPISGGIANVTRTYQADPFGSLGFEQPRGLAFDPAIGTLYIGGATRVLSLEIDATPSGFYLTGFNDVRGVAVDPGTGALFVVEAGTSQIIRLAGLRDGKGSAKGVVQHNFGGPGGGVGQFSNPRGIAVDNDGLVFVVDRGNHRVQVLDGRTQNINWLFMFGGHKVARSVVDCMGAGTICPIPPADGFDGPGCVTAQDNNTIWTTDEYNGRIQRWIHDSYADDIWPYAKSAKTGKVRSNRKQD